MIFDIDNWREITATLARNKTRTFLTAFGIFWGTAMLALLWGGTNGLKTIMSANFDGFASNSAVVFPMRTTMPYKGYQKGMTWALTQTDIDNIRRIAPEFEVVSPMINVSSTIKHADRTYSTDIQGLDPTYTQVMNPIVVKGRFINDSDIASSAKVCLLGENTANNLFGNDEPIGQFVEADNVFYKVVGIVKQKSDASINGRLDNAMVLPQSTCRRAYNLGERVHFMMLIARDGYSPTELRPKMYRALRINHPLHPDDQNNLFFMDISEQFKMVDNIMLGIDMLILFVGLSSLIAGIIGVGNIMWIIVKERTKEFGIRRAIGAKPRSILVQILSESAILTALAGTTGLCFAVGILALANHMIEATGNFMPGQINFQLSFNAAITIMLLFLSLGSVAGAVPAFKAMKIKPIEALNDK